MVRAPQDSLGHALADIARHPHVNLIRTWSWKTAAISALLRACIFLISNRHAGAAKAAEAMGVEAVFAIFASGFLGAVTQRLRDTRPLWATALTVWLVMPALMLAAQLEVHRLGRTAHMRAGLTASFIFASVASGFTWYAMRRGTLLMDVGNNSLAHDMRSMPRVILDFVLWPLQGFRAK